MQENNCYYVNKNLEYTKLSMHNFEKLFINFFYAPKYPQSDQYIDSLQKLASFFTEAIYVFIDIEKCPDIAKAFGISVIPTIVLSDANKKIIKSLEKPQVNELILTLEEDLALFNTNFAIEKQRMFIKIEEILNINPVMVFIKGTPQEPKCGFTSSLLEIVKSFGLNFGYFNILEDENVRNWLRYYAKWNTYPQLHIEKKLVGGLDVVKDLVAKGKFEEILPFTSRKSDPDSKIQRILNDCKEKIVVFMKDFVLEESKLMMKVLKENGVKFVISEVKNDEKLEGFLLEKYKEKALPLCFIQGEFIGNIGAIKEICAKNFLLKLVPQTEWSLNSKQKFEFLINNFKVICFIEGCLEEEKPENRKLFEIFKKNQIEFEYFNVLSDNEMREIVMEDSKLTSFPQIYRNRKVVGGFELVQEIEKKGEIKHLFE